MTTHKAQGVTVDRAIINIDSTQKQLNSRNNYYVNISRSKQEISIYTDSKEKIKKQINQLTKKVVADDFKKEQTIQKGIFNNEIKKNIKFLTAVLRTANKEICQNIEQMKIKFK